jgi:hypothetical protein
VSDKRVPEVGIQSLLRRTYPNEELIILNGCRGPELICDAAVFAKSPERIVVRLP